jgi:hypothetical protein
MAEAKDSKVKCGFIKASSSVTMLIEEKHGSFLSREGSYFFKALYNDFFDNLDLIAISPIFIPVPNNNVIQNRRSSFNNRAISS